MKGTAIGLVVGSFICLMQSFEYFRQSDPKGLVMLGIGGVFLFLAKYAWDKKLGDPDD